VAATGECIEGAAPAPEYPPMLAGGCGPCCFPGEQRLLGSAISFVRDAQAATPAHAVAAALHGV